MKKVILFAFVIFMVTACTQVQKADQVLNALDGSRIKLLKLTDEQLKERWHILDRKNKEDRNILDSMSWSKN